jgi:hypothetical protein
LTRLWEDLNLVEITTNEGGSISHIEEAGKHLNVELGSDKGFEKKNPKLDTIEGELKLLLWNRGPR